MKYFKMFFLGMTVSALFSCSTTPTLITEDVDALVPSVKQSEAADKSNRLKKLHDTLLSQQSAEIRAAMKSYIKNGKAPIISNKQFLQYPFEESQPIIQCQTLRACDIELEEGETITGQIHVGDSSRWIYSESYSGSGSAKKIHIIVKPTENDISTNMIITTNRRTYYLGLLSKQGIYARRVKFYYPRDIQHFTGINKDTLNALHEISSLPNIDITKVDNHYEIKPVHKWFSEDPTWMPTNVFNDGKRHVFIQMPGSLDKHDLPALFVIKHNGKQALVNYRIRNGWYIVDDLFQQAVLISGTGNNQERVVIRYMGEKE